MHSLLPGSLRINLLFRRVNIVWSSSLTRREEGKKDGEREKSCMSNKWNKKGKNVG